MVATQPIQVGDPFRPFRLRGIDGEVFDLARHVGKTFAIFFYLDDMSPACRAEITAFRDLQDEFTKLGVVVMGIGVDPVESHRAVAEELGVRFPLLADESATVSLAYGIARQESGGEQPTLSIGRSTLLIGPNLRVARVYHVDDPGAHAAQVLADARAVIQREPPRQMVQHAPVLLIPDVLPPQLCQRLISIWENDGNEESGFMRQVDGKTVGMVDYNHKIRRDHFLRGGGEIEAELKHHLGTKVVPEIFKAFNYRVTRREDFRIACYDSSRGGYFRPHRDNTTDGTAHRRFALSLLLNDDYDGGYLRFPEYAPHHYRPDAGAAVIFSCSLLHEATDVTRGRRFVLLSFFYGEQEARMREEYNARTGGGYRA
jgi:peroxiredoxin/predicted 2-oxoglutarate/Fe(II)-dependent dioxygenase YbiX